MVKNGEEKMGVWKSINMKFRTRSICGLQWSMAMILRVGLWSGSGAKITSLPKQMRLPFRNT